MPTDMNGGSNFSYQAIKFLFDKLLADMEYDLTIL